MFSDGRPRSAQMNRLWQLVAVLVAADQVSKQLLVEAPARADPAGCKTGAPMSLLAATSGCVRGGRSGKETWEV